MPKITVEIKKPHVTYFKTGPLRPKPEEIQKVNQILLSTLFLFRKLEWWEDGLGIIKATISRDESELWVEFYLALTPPVVPTSIPKPEEFKIFCRWHDPHVFLFVSKGDANNHSQLPTISLQDNKVDTVARALIEATGMVIMEQINQNTESGKWMIDSWKALQPLYKI